MRRSILLFALASALFSTTTLLSAEVRKRHSDTSSAAAAAQRFVELALHSELEGDLEGRTLYLQEALELDRDHAPARWRLGQVQIDGRWLSFEEAVDHVNREKRLVAYQRRRAETDDTPRQQFELAAWCKQQKLYDEARAHFFSALNNDQRYSAQAESFGLVQQDNIWMTREQAKRLSEQERADRIALARWKPLIARLKSQILRSDESRAAAARDELLAIRDPQAVPAIEAVFSTDNTQESLLAVAALENIPGQRAATTLTQLAVLNASPEVRQAAAEALAPRSYYCYAPLLLAALQAPLEARFETIEQAGAAVVRLTLLREGPMANVVLNETLQVAPDVGSEELGGTEFAESQRSRNREQAIVNQQRAAAQARVGQVNQRIGELNHRVESVLATAAGAAGSRPRELWQWWYDHNDIYYPPEYPTVEHSETYTQLYNNVSECFVAGTPVWTATGLRPIETIEVGDRVLAQDVETGELQFKPVLATSVRPPTELLRLHISGEEFVTTRGHPLWVNGQGWRMAKELSVGDQVHTAQGAVEVESIEPGPEAEAYNFVVAELNNYFVGHVKLLVHDNSLRRHTDAVLPGLVLPAGAKSASNSR